MDKKLKPIISGHGLPEKGPWEVGGRLRASRRASFLPKDVLFFAEIYAWKTSCTNPILTHDEKLVKVGTQHIRIAHFEKYCEKPSYHHNQITLFILSSILDN